MKKTGRGTAYRSALSENLVKNLLEHKKIQTTRSRGKLIAQQVRKELKKKITMTPAPSRRGDNSPQVIIEIIDLVKGERNAADQHKAKTDTKNMASR